jgi:hypothetical protein
MQWDMENAYTGLATWKTIGQILLDLREIGGEDVEWIMWSKV